MVLTAFNERARRDNVHTLAFDFGHAGGAERGDHDAGFSDQFLLC